MLLVLALAGCDRPPAGPIDADRDGFAAAADCDDARADVHPDATERCDGIDNDCDALVDDDDDVPREEQATWWPDADGDGHGNPAGDTTRSCAPGPAQAATGDDCDDADPTVHPDAAELCDDLDQDCDGLVDDELVFLPFWPDRDTDGYGDPAGPSVSRCGPEPGASATSDDCNDRDAGVNPGEVEICGGADEDCDGLVDDADPSRDPASTDRWYGDDDHDGYGDPVDIADTCVRPDGFVTNALDCDDADEALALVLDWYLDGDGDGVGDGIPTGFSCAPPSDDHASEALGVDCDDADPARYPGADEVCEDAIDQDCSGTDAICRVLGPDLLANAEVILEGETNPEFVGWSLDAVGDFDCDGVPDVLTGAPFTGGGNQEPGAALVFSGASLTAGTWGSSTATAQLNGLTQTWAGYDVAGLGDVNFDGCDDVLVGGSDALGGNGGYYGFLPAFPGMSWLVHGGVTGARDLAVDADATFVGEVPADFAGESVAGLGDADGDAVPDALVTARGNDRAYLVSGGAIGVTPLAGATAELIVGQGPLMNVAGPGDVDGDGLADLVVSEPMAADGLVHLVLGAPSGVLPLGAADDATLTGAAPGDLAGIAVADAVDANLDGYADLVVAANGSDAGGLDSGAMFVVHGPVAGVLSLATADAIVAAEAGDLASAVAGAGDADADGSPDLLVGSSGGPGATGVAWLAPGPFAGTVLLATDGIRLDGSATGYYEGFSLAGIGDVDRDGFDDLAIGAPKYEGAAPFGGAVFLVFGGLTP